MKNNSFRLLIVMNQGKHLLRKGLYVKK